jgi:hypothetical protein
VTRLIQIDGLVEVARLLAPPPPGHAANLEELTERINAAVNTINVRRTALCIEVGGRNFEQLL